MRTQKDTTSRSTRYMLLALLSPALLGPPKAQAQGADVEEITVTARKREEGLQEVPMAITAIDGLESAKLNIQNVEELYGRVPGLFFTSAGGAGPNSDFIYLQIRGVGFNGGLEPAVGVFVDGMYMPQVGFDLDFLSELKALSSIRNFHISDTEAPRAGRRYFLSTGGSCKAGTWF